MHISDTLNVVPCQSARVVAGFRCRICGLLFGRAAGVVQHFRELHPPHETRENALYEPMRVVRPEHCFKPPVGSTHSSDGSSSSLALAQPGAQVPTLEHARNLVGVFTAMLDYVQVGAPVPDDGASEEEGLTPANWCAFVRACVKGSLWHIFPNWWSSFMSLVLLGTYRGCTLGTFEPSRTLGERMRGRVLADARSAAVLMGQVLQRGQQLVTLPINLFVKSLINAFMHVSAYLSIRPSIHPTIQSSIRPFMHTFIKQSSHPSIRPAIHRSIQPSIDPSVHPDPSIHPSPS